MGDASGKCDLIQETSGQRQVIDKNCQGTGCRADGNNQDCAWCVYDLAKCRSIYGDVCNKTKASRDAHHLKCQKPGPKTKCDIVERSSGQRQVINNKCEGVGCNADGKNQDCAWCVYDLAKCRTVYGKTCDQTKAARDAH